MKDLAMALSVFELALPYSRQYASMWHAQRARRLQLWKLVEQRKLQVAQREADDALGALRLREAVQAETLRRQETDKQAAREGQYARRMAAQSMQKRLLRDATALFPQLRKHLYTRALMLRQDHA